MAKRKIKNLRIDEVSLVDRPANLHPFMFVKRDGDGDDATMQKQFKSLDFSFTSDGSAEGTVLRVNGSEVAELRSVILSSSRMEDDDVAIFAEYTVATKNETPGGFSSTRTYTLRKSDGQVEIGKALAEDTAIINEYLNDVPPAMRQSLERILGAVSGGGPAVKESKTMPNEDGSKPTESKATPVDVDAIAAKVADQLSGPLSERVAATVLDKIKADQAAAREAADKATKEAADKEAETQAKIDAGELLEFDSPDALEAELASQATQDALAEE